MKSFTGGFGIGLFIGASVQAFGGHWTAAAGFALLGAAVCCTWFGMTLAVLSLPKTEGGRTR